MSELRLNPTTGEWVIVATHRVNRPFLPKDTCPFCPGSPNIPNTYDVMIYPNDFPSLMTPAPPIEIKPPKFSKVAPIEGFCDVVLYSPKHDATLGTLPLNDVIKVVHLWQSRYHELARYDHIKYILIFENRGKEVGVTIHHPHGQIYAFPFIPPIPAKELHHSQTYHTEHGSCLFCDILTEELQLHTRIVMEDDHFVTFVPFFAKYPYEVHIYPRRHIQHITELTHDEVTSLAHTLRRMIRKYDNLANGIFPLIMLFHQAPVDGTPYPYYHFHIEFYSPYITRDKLKYLAGCEQGAGVVINSIPPETSAAKLRSIDG